MNEISPSNPFHVSRAYDAAVPTVPAVGAPAPAVPPITRESEDGIAGSIGPRQAIGVARLVAGMVPGGIDFTTPVPTPSRESLPFYRNPADQNAAATVMARGRRVDVKG